MTRIQREEKTVSAMIELYCRAHHPVADVPCAKCSELRDYALARLDRCPFAAKKPTCAKCPIHCYRADMRVRIKEAMRYSGPRMLRRHPLLAAMHQLDSLRPSGTSQAGH